MFNADNFLQQNLWRTDKSKLISWYFRRTVWKGLVQGLDGNTPLNSLLIEGKSLLLSGPRGAGKSTLLQLAIKHLIIEKNIPPQAIFYFNLDDVIMRDGFTSADEVVKFINGFRPDNKTQLWIFIDEVQYLQPGLVQELQKAIPDARWIMTSSVRGNTAHDGHTPACADASAGRPKSPLNRGDLSGEKSPLPQRDPVRGITRGEQKGCVDTIYLELGPVSYKEYLQRMLEPDNIYLPDGEDGQPSIKRPEKIKELPEPGYFARATPLLDEYLRYGGYGLVVREYTAEKRPSLIRQVYQGILPAKAGKLLETLAQFHGSVLNIGKLAYLSKLNRKTVPAYLDTLEENYLINRVYPYTEKGTQAGMPLVYLNDSGLRNMLLNNMFSETAGRSDRRILLDGFLYNELRMIPYIRELCFWRSETTETTVFCFKYGVVHNLAGVLPDFPQAKAGRVGLVNLGRRVKARKIIILTNNYAGWEEVGTSTVVYLPAVYTWLIPQVLGE